MWLSLHLFIFKSSMISPVSISLSSNHDNFFSTKSYVSRSIPLTSCISTFLAFGFTTTSCGAWYTRIISSLWNIRIFNIVLLAQHSKYLTIWNTYLDACGWFTNHAFSSADHCFMKFIFFVSAKSYSFLALLCLFLFLQFF